MCSSDMQFFSIQRQPTAARPSTTLPFTELLTTAHAWHGNLVGGVPQISTSHTCMKSMRLLVPQVGGTHI